MLKIEAVGAEQPRSDIKIKVAQFGDSVEILAQTGSDPDDYWVLANLEEYNGRLVLFLAGSISDSLIATDEKGQILVLDQDR